MAQYLPGILVACLRKLARRENILGESNMSLVASPQLLDAGTNAWQLAALTAAPQWLDSGNNAWQLAAATFVALQSIPGLTVLYGGIVKKKWAINSAFMSMYAFSPPSGRIRPIEFSRSVMF